MSSDFVESLARQHPKTVASQIPRLVAVLDAILEGKSTVDGQRIDLLVLRSHLEAMGIRMHRAASKERGSESAMVEKLARYTQVVEVLGHRAAMVPVRGHYVYILEGARHQPLYVGYSGQLMSRLGQHMREKKKRQAVRWIRFIELADREEALMVERYLIMVLKPPLNMQVPSWGIGPDELTSDGLHNLAAARHHRSYRPDERWRQLEAAELEALGGRQLETAMMMVELRGILSAATSGVAINA